jgi:hypothetical protein
MECKGFMFRLTMQALAEEISLNPRGFCFWEEIEISLEAMKTAIATRTGETDITSDQMILTLGQVREILIQLKDEEGRE